MTSHDPDLGSPPARLEPASSTPKRGRRAVLPIVAVALVLLFIAFLEGDLPDVVADLGALIRGVLNRYGAPASLTLLYVEESGVPIVIPGDVYVAYLGKLAAGSAPKLIASWLGIIAVVLAGSSNLYWASRLWGRRLLGHPRVSSLLRLDADRLAQAAGWLARWGVLAIIFGRHVPGLRIPITVVAGTLKVPYRIFVPSVAVSSAAWAALGLWLGATFGRSIGSFLTGNRLLYVLVVVAVVLLVAFALIQIWRRSRRPEPGPPATVQTSLRGKPPADVR
ncbi:VTT domain-containing protein [Candidatus Nephthysia bennettiae]|uniref:VTT domain-containing protein n=1 Tax=Candidatus Nephthysia bennettiae TaxID=3127016 RepID=A0A934K1C9_9BACT|nr:VTT domain-containing protein [Candidatus Dormibacteraeota bacterium]MBJ7613121.1 VTT domain-containing protein [Candidatus Dormibacteraeota bacterium]